MSEKWLKGASRPVLILLHLAGYKTFECPLLIRRYRLCRLAWNTPSILLFLLIFLRIILGTAILKSAEDVKRQLPIIVLTTFRLSSQLYLYKSRKSIQALIANLSTISQKFRPGAYIKVIVIAHFCILLVINVMVDTATFNIEKKFSYKNQILNLMQISVESNPHFALVVDIYSKLEIISMYLPFMCFSCYFFLVCLCLKKFLSDFVSKYQDSGRQHSPGRIMNTYEEITEAMDFASQLLSCHALIFVIMSLFGLFLFTYTFAFQSQTNYYDTMYLLAGILHHMIILLSIMISGDAANEAAQAAKSSIKFMGSWIPKPYRDSDLYLRQRLKPIVEMTLWGIYRIDKSLLINSVGVLLSYGILLGTLGSVGNEESTPTEECNRKD